MVRAGTWVLLAVVAMALGVALIRFAMPAPRVVVPGGTHEIVSRAADSEMEVSPVLALGADGSVAVAWVAMRGGRNGEGEYVGVRVSRGGSLGPLLKLPRKPHTSSPSIVGLGDGFLVAWLAGDEVYAVRVSRDAASEPVLVDNRAHGAPRVVAVGSDRYVVVSGERDIGVWRTDDGMQFEPREVIRDAGTSLVAVCGIADSLLVTWLSSKPAVMVASLSPLAAAPVMASAPSEHIVHAAPTCFLDDKDAFVVYGVTDKPDESGIADALVFAHSKDAGRSFATRAAWRPPAHLLDPTVLRRTGGAFAVLAVAGGGPGDAHASASLFDLSADGHSQSGLTQLVASPVTMTASADEPGYMGDSLGLAQAGGVTWAAVADNASGESHVALVQVK